MRSFMKRKYVGKCNGLAVLEETCKREICLLDIGIGLAGKRNKKTPLILIPWDACGTPTVKIRFGCTQLCKASQ